MVEVFLHILAMVLEDLLPEILIVGTQCSIDRYFNFNNYFSHPASPLLRFVCFVVHRTEQPPLHDLRGHFDTRNRRCVASAVSLFHSTARFCQPPGRPSSTSAQMELIAAANRRTPSRICSTVYSL